MVHSTKLIVNLGRVYDIVVPTLAQMDWSNHEKLDRFGHWHPEDLYPLSMYLAIKRDSRTSPLS